MSIAKYYNRVGYVVLHEGNKTFDKFRGLNFKFTCEYCSSPGNGAEAQASVGILGLTRQMVYDWASFCNHMTDKGYAGLMGSGVRSVSVYAGYEMSFTGRPLFTLPVTGAWPTSPPDMWLNISAYNTNEFNSHVYSIEMHAPLGGERRLFTFKQICQKIADTIGARLDFTAYNENLLGGFPDVSFQGTTSDILHWLNSNSCAYAEIRINSPDLELPVLVVFQVDPKTGADLKVRNGNMRDRQIIKTPPTISAETGMIGLPKLKAGNNRASEVEVTTLLRNDIEPGDIFYVKSDYVKFGNAPFKANKIKHEGEFRGNTWQTTITGIDPLAQESEKKK